jgi:hypothetical protein
MDVVAFLQLAMRISHHHSAIASLGDSHAINQGKSKLEAYQPFPRTMRRKIQKKKCRVLLIQGVQ